MVAGFTRSAGSDLSRARLTAALVFSRYAPMSNGCGWRAPARVAVPDMRRIYRYAAGARKRFLKMEVSETISCPFCGESFELSIDTSVPDQSFVTDCEVCCRPFTVSVQAEPGEIISINVS